MLGAMPKPARQTIKTIDEKQQGAAHDPALHKAARALYWQRWRIADIAQYLQVPRTTLHDWKAAERWEKSPPVERIENTLDARINVLINREHKSNADYKELDALLRSMERTARIKKYQESNKEADLNPNIERRNDAPRKPRKGRNHLTDDQVAALKRAFLETLYDYQLTWYENIGERVRMIIKSRQIGATWYFAREALINALESGTGQIFISASKAQALVFREYIVAFVEEVTSVRLSGETIMLSNGAKLRFVGTNSRTAQSYNGNLYIDEFFWINNYSKLKELASGMSSHKHLRMTYFSTPSAKSHEAYPYWTGEEVNRHRAKNERLVIDLADELLRVGAVGGDLVWRHRVTIYDAQAGGCDLFDIERLKIENSPDAFANKYECEFIDDSLSAFSFSALKRCMIDADVSWSDFKRYTERPFGDMPVWVGHDASYTGDNSSICVMAPPLMPGGKFRLLEYQRHNGADFDAQAQALREITERYNVVYMGIDASGGYGRAVYDIVVKFYPQASALNYDLALKIRLVLKAQSVINKGRFEMDVREVEVMRAFLSIRKTLTQSQKNITFETGRSDETGHGDAAWSCMHVFINEPLDAQTVSESEQGFMEIFE